MQRQREHATDKLHAFLDLAVVTPDYIFIFHCCITALRLGIRLLDYPPCATLMEKMERLQSSARMTSFAYDYATVCVEYYQAFPEQLTRKAEETQAFFLIDIDLFKAINDNYGHAFGDRVIAKVAETIESLDELNKIAGHFGGDEFLVFLYHQPSVNAIKQTADEMMAQIHCCIQLPDERVRQITTSVGICVIDSDRTSTDAFLDADQLLYRAKELGRNRFEINR